ncbi:MAG: hypothetical protein WCT37_04490 [Patescibacteria group bacterium]|jgi:hypothetical protein
MVDYAACQKEKTAENNRRWAQQIAADKKALLEQKTNQEELREVSSCCGSAVRCIMTGAITWLKISRYLKDKMVDDIPGGAVEVYYCRPDGTKTSGGNSILPANMPCLLAI